MLTMGLDIGSITSNIAFVYGEGPIYTKVSFTGYNAEKAWRNIFDKTLDRMQLKESSLSVSIRRWRKD
jgi:activator of 2-hydroxyglutaryl-CoA dehydratase